MDADRNLLFAVLALQADLLSNDRFAEACSAWAARKENPLADLLVERGWLTPEDRADVERLLARKLAKHHGDARASLAEALPAQVRDSVDALREEPRSSSPPIQSTTAPDGPALASTTAPLARSLQRYVLGRLHATGGIGRVWLAHDPALGREVALKELRPERAGHPAHASRFLKEAQVTGQLEHPGIVPIYEVGRRPDDGAPFYTMRFVRGRTLADAAAAYHERRKRGADGPAGLRDLLTALVGVCQAVAYAHSRGVLHRDLKPENVVLGDYGEVIVLDWGLARLLDQPADDLAAPLELSPDSHQATQQGQVLGTPAYMAPEQAEGRLDLLGPRTDVYGLGAVLYKLLTGRPPFTGPDVPAVLRRVLTEEVAPPRALVRPTPRALEAVCLKALAKSPADRYASAGEMAKDVQRFLADEPVSVYREPVLSRLFRWGRRHRTVVSAAAALLLTATAALGVSTFLISKEQQATRAQKEQAERQRDRADGNYRLARKAVDDAVTHIAENKRLRQADLAPLRKELLASALPFYQEFVRQQSDDLELEAERGRAYVRLGAVHSELGDKARALDCFSQSQAVFGKLVEQEPAGVSYRADWAGTYTNRGATLNDLGRFREAEAEYREGQKHTRALAADFPGEPRYVFDLTKNQIGLGNALSGQQKLAAAEEEYRAACQHLEKLAAGHPDEPTYRNLWGSGLANLCVLLLYVGKNDEALKTAREERRVFQALVSRHPEEPDYGRKLADAHGHLGSALTAIGKIADGEKAYRERVARLDRLAAAFPSLANYRRLAAHAKSNLAIALIQQRKLAEAEPYFRASVQTLQRLAAEFPAVLLHQRELAEEQSNLGNLLNERGKRPEAETCLRESLKTCEQFAAGPSALAADRDRLAAGHNNLAILLSGRGRLAEAVAEYEAANKLLEPLAERFPQVVRYAVTLAGQYCNLGNALVRMKKPQDALGWYDKAVARLEALLAKDNRLSLPRKTLRNTYQGKAEALSKLGRYDEALVAYRKALDLDNGTLRAALLLGRANTLIRANKLQDAVADLESVLKGKPAPVTLYNAACAYALATAAVKPDSEPGRRYARRAIELLRQARGAGYFKEPRRVKEMKEDEDLRSLRGRDDFRKLLGELEKGS
jgi:serine/threonine-protein kinase